MSKLSVHPHRGYLNTKFSIQSFAKEKKIVYIYPIDNPDCDKSVIRPILLNEETLRTDYVFKVPGRYAIMLLDDESSSIEIEVKDAIKFGGSKHKNSYVFDETPWCFIVMKDRTYFYNRENGEEYVENISPDQISYINKDIVLLSNDNHNEKTLYSLPEQAPIITFTDAILLQNNILIVKDNDVKKLNVYHFADRILDKKEYKYEDFSICTENRILCIYNNQQIDVVSLNSFETIKTSLYNYNFIKFTNGHYFIQLKPRLSCTIISIKDILSNQSWQISSKYPISVCEGVELVELNDIHSEKEKVNELFDLAKNLDLFNTERIQILGGINISYKYTEIQKLYISSGKLYYLSNEKNYTINGYGAKCQICKTYLKISNCDFSVEINSKFPVITPQDDCILITTHEHLSIIKNEEFIFSKNATVHHFDSRTIISVKEDDTHEDIYEFYDGKVVPLLKGCFNWRYFEKYGILEQKENKALYALSPQDKGEFQKLNQADHSSSIFESALQNSLKHGERYLYYRGVMLWNTKIALPENITAISEKKNYAISIYGSHIFLGRISKFKDSFVNEKILESLFDSSFYGKVLMSDDGENIIYQKDNEMFLMNTTTNEVQKFPNQSFICQINGYRPLFKVDGSHRRPRIINPLTKDYINQDYITNYRFVSPDGKLYADSALHKYVKYYDKVNDTFISKEQWNAVSEKYNYEYWTTDNITENKKEEARKEFINAHKDFFKDEDLDNLLKIRDFRNKITDEFGYAIIRKVETDEIYCEIELGAKLWFLNYVAFSHDSRYVAIAGRYPNDTIIDNHRTGGLLLIYDMAKRKVISNNKACYAVWTAAFTKEGFYAAYDSRPTLLYGNVGMIGEIEEITGRNFLTFSPDGKYMALSNQGYISYSDNRLNWGHQPSTSVYIHAIDNPKTQIMTTINDLSDAGIADTNEAQSVSSCSFSLDNKKLMLVGNDGTVVIRNLYLD